MEATARVSDFCMKRIMFHLAGYITEKKFLGGVVTKSLINGANTDNHDALDFADCITNSNVKEGQVYLAWLNVRTRKEVEIYFPIIKAVALKLYEQKTMTGNELRECIRGSDND
jgi:hypothetical protein